jgi:hypothetical protein
MTKSLAKTLHKILGKNTAQIPKQKHCTKSLAKTLHKILSKNTAQNP